MEFKPSTSAMLNGGHEKSFPNDVLDSSPDEMELMNGIADETPDESDFAHWSSADVAKHFDILGFAKQAPVFLKEEIDGKALMLLRRKDVISGLSLKLGPAVKIYQHILSMQSKNSPLNLVNGMT